MGVSYKLPVSELHRACVSHELSTCEPSGRDKVTTGIRGTGCMPWPSGAHRYKCTLIGPSN